MSTSDLSVSLRELYAAPEFTPSSWSDPADRAFISIYLIERSIAALAGRLHGRMIDVGCGRQPYRSYFSHLDNVVACDYDASRGNVDFACPAHAIPVPDESFDAVLCTEVLEHVPDPLAVWREFYRILRPGGRVLLTTPMYWPAHEEPYDYYRYPRCGLEFLAKRAGFQIEELWPRGGMWAFFGQVIMHVLPQYMPFAWMRRWCNGLALRIDRSRTNPNLTLGWTILAVKPAGETAS